MIAADTALQAGEIRSESLTSPAPRRSIENWTGPALVATMSDDQLLKRFVARKDAEAFAALVQRHGPRLLSVCRRLLGDYHAAEDACQATFLVLLRRAQSLTQPELLANWLYRVAVRIASKARAKATRQLIHERRIPAVVVPEPAVEVVQRDLRSRLVAEIQGLPEHYRAPLVLCYLEGNTNVQAARQLGCPTGSMSYRLARGREMLRNRLIESG